MNMFLIMVGVLIVELVKLNIRTYSKVVYEDKYFSIKKTFQGYKVLKKYNDTSGVYIGSFLSLKKAYNLVVSETNKILLERKRYDD